MYAEPTHFTWSMVIAPGFVIIFLSILAGFLFWYYRHPDDRDFFAKQFYVFGPILVLMSFGVSFTVVDNNNWSNERKQFEEIYGVDITVTPVKGGVVGDIPHYDNPQSKIVPMYFVETRVVRDCYVSLDEDYLYNVVCDGEDITVE